MNYVNTIAIKPITSHSDIWKPWPRTIHISSEFKFDALALALQASLNSQGTSLLSRSGVRYNRSSRERQEEKQEEGDAGGKKERELHSALSGPWRLAASSLIPQKERPVRLVMNAMPLLNVLAQEKTSPSGHVSRNDFTNFRCLGLVEWCLFFSKLIFKQSSPPWFHLSNNP